MKGDNIAKLVMSAIIGVILIVGVTVPLIESVTTGDEITYSNELDVQNRLSFINEEHNITYNSVDGLKVDGEIVPDNKTLSSVVYLSDSFTIYQNSSTNENVMTMYGIKTGHVSRETGTMDLTITPTEISGTIDGVDVSGSQTSVLLFDADGDYISMNMNRGGAVVESSDQFYFGGRISGTYYAKIGNALYKSGIEDESLTFVPTVESIEGTDLEKITAYVIVDPTDNVSAGVSNVVVPFSVTFVGEPVVTGSTSTIVSLLPVFMVIGLIVGIAVTIKLRDRT